MYHKPRERRSWFAGWGYLGISLLLATPLTVGFSSGHQVSSLWGTAGNLVEPGGHQRRPDLRNPDADILQDREVAVEQPRALGRHTPTQ